MDAIKFNNAIQIVLMNGEQSFGREGFDLRDSPEIQEDSGDLVASEAINLSFINSKLGIELRFFLCCGKGVTEDFVSIKFRAVDRPQLVVDLSQLSPQLGLRLHQLNFNDTRQPMEGFLVNYFSELKSGWSHIITQVQVFLTVQNQHESSLTTKVFADYL
jgi:hypothetical protein